ncbi:MAG: CDP-alcohol phosphatidyltransferase family protein [bacterium]|nr:CDP-alcohol phosphatidyltransferase family protein [bacterium]
MMEPRDEAYRRWIFTIPNVICMIRMLGSIGLLGLAVAGQTTWFVICFVVLTISDWVDGYLARHLRQRSDLGARIDSLADFMLFGALLIGALILRSSELADEWLWLIVGVASYALTSMAGLIKYGKIPSYHTWAAKKTQFVVLIAGIVIIMGWAVWPVRLAAVAVTLTNLEATAITLVSPKWQADVPSLWSVIKRSKQQPNS